MLFGIAMLTLWLLLCNYRFPNLKNVKELIYKKGRGFLDKEPFPLTSNDLIEKVHFHSILTYVTKMPQPIISREKCSNI